MKKIKCLFRTDEIHADGRVYPKSVMKKAFKKFQKIIDKKQSFGCVYQGHNEYKSAFWRGISGQPLTDISHTVDKIEEVSNGFLVRVHPLNTSKGKILQSIVDPRSKMNINGLAHFKKNGDIKDLSVISFDFILDEKGKE